MNKIALLCLLLCVMQALSCTKEEDVQDSTSTIYEDPSENETEKLFIDNLGEYDFDGEEFNVLVRATRVDDMFVESSSGEIVNDALYNSVQKILERFNAEIAVTTLPDDGNVWNSTIEEDVRSGSGEFDVVMPDYYWGCETRGMFMNLLKLDELDFSQPWWCSGWNDNAEINGRIYNAVGSMSLDLYKNNMAIFFSWQLIDDMGLDDPYELVRSNNWTLDKLLEMSHSALADLNGDGIYDWDNDRIGFGFGTHAGRGLPYSMGVRLATETEDRSYEYSFMNERFVDIYQRLYNLVNNDDSVKYNDCNGVTGMGIDLYPGFMANRLLFLATALRATEDFRDMTDDYGIIPYPMYDCEQENYVTYNLGTSFMAVPLTAKNPEMSAVMLEALNAEFYKNVVPAYLDVALKNKYSRDANTAEMIDLINNSVYFDFAFVNASTSMNNFIFDQIVNKRENIVSVWESIRSGKEANLAKLIEYYNSVS